MEICVGENDPILSRAVVQKYVKGRKPSGNRDFQRVLATS